MPAARSRDPREVGGAWARFQRHGHRPPCPALAPVIARYWWARWDLRGQPGYRQLLVPGPSVHLTFATDGTALVRGIPRRHFHRTLAGEGGVFGVTFRPGTFRRFLGRPVATLAGRAVPAADVLGAVFRDLPGLAVLEAELLDRLVPDPVADEVAGWVEEIARSPELDRVDLAAGRFGVGQRRLQRLFAEHVGATPKWIIRRYRLQEVTERLERLAPGARPDWAGLAAALGYADQAHLTRDFTSMFGEPPTAYAARY